MTSPTRQDLLDAIRDLADGKVHTPTISEMKEDGEYSTSPYYTKFDGWNDALREAGYNVNMEKNLSEKTEQEYIDDVKRVADKVGKAPSIEDITEHGKWSAPTYWNHVTVEDGDATWSGVLKKAGFTPHREYGARETKECEICGSEMEVTPYYSDRRFCSSDCFGEHRKGKYSDEDHWRYVERVTVECESCGSEVERLPRQVEKYGRQFCDASCRGGWMHEHFAGEDNPQWEGGHVEYGKGWTEGKKEKVRDRDGRKCQSCGMQETEHKERWGERLAIHHIIPARQFDDPTSRNAMGNLVSLCNECHGRWEGIPLKPELA